MQRYIEKTISYDNLYLKNKKIEEVPVNAAKTTKSIYIWLVYSSQNKPSPFFYIPFLSLLSVKNLLPLEILC